MNDVYVKFEREDLDGIVAIGSYLIDVLKRFGIARECDCANKQSLHECEVTITQGADLLSPMTAAETEHFGEDGRKNQVRLACQAKIERPGEIVIMTKEKKKEPKETTASKNDEYRKEFTELPLEQKIANLVKLEAITFGETVSFVVNSPFKIFEKIGDVMAEFGLKLENEAKQAERPAEHRDTSGKSEPGDKAKTSSAGTRAEQKKTGDN